MRIGSVRVVEMKCQCGNEMTHTKDRANARGYFSFYQCARCGKHAVEKYLGHADVEVEWG
jgi:predicted SprT family Zn-dependent metalloprotease